MLVLHQGFVFLLGTLAPRISYRRQKQDPADVTPFLGDEKDIQLMA